MLVGFVESAAAAAAAAFDTGCYICFHSHSGCWYCCQNQKHTSYFTFAFPTVFVLSSFPHLRSIFGTPVVISGDANYSPATATLAPDVNANMNTTGKRAASPAAELHASVEQGDGEAVARLLSQHQQHRRDEQELGGDDAERGEARRRDWLLLVDCACPRTGMTPLLKAVERGSEGSVRALLQAGADVRSRVSVKGVGCCCCRRCCCCGWCC